LVKKFVNCAQIKLNQHVSTRLLVSSAMINKINYLIISKKLSPNLHITILIISSNKCKSLGYNKSISNNKFNTIVSPNKGLTSNLNLLTIPSNLVKINSKTINQNVTISIPNVLSIANNLSVFATVVWFQFSI
jgi:3-hydroxymyristoyl/3-hydroxydecanoyl-(acyl carrier protein) dehydratase